MKTWTIHDVTSACEVTTDELNQWISRGLFLPSQPTRRGKWRQFDWRDLTCLSVMASLRKMRLPVTVAAHVVAVLGAEIAGMDEINKPLGLFLFVTGSETSTLVGPETLASLLNKNNSAAIIVDVTRTYHAASVAIRATPRCASDR